MKIYMRVTQDEYELPLVIASSVQVLADKLGVKRNTIESSLCKYYKGQLKTSPYRVVEVEDD